MLSLTESIISVRFKTMCDQDRIGKLKENEAIFEWEISDFSEIFEKSKVSTTIESPKFKAIIHDQISEWQLELSPKGNEARRSNFITLNLKCLNDVEAYVKASLIIVNSQNIEVDKQMHPYALFKKGKSVSVTSISHKFLFNNKEDLLPKDKLTVRCKLILDKSEEYYEKIRKGKVEDFEDFGMLFNNKKLSDFTILGSDHQGEYTFYAHKYVLAKKSEVFKAMFDNDMLESKKKSVNIEYIQYHTMEEMLRYIYTSQIFDIEYSAHWIS